VIDEFVLVERLGAGGFSEVWQARDRQGEFWALKLPRVEWPATPTRSP
jgi:serine/threonine protein kinase